jgi:hypothetical protein
MMPLYLEVYIIFRRSVTLLFWGKPSCLSQWELIVASSTGGSFLIDINHSPDNLRPICEGRSMDGFKDRVLQCFTS